MKTLEDLKTENEQLKLQIKQLKHQLENFESLQRGKCCDCCEDAVISYSDLLIKFEDLKGQVKALVEYVE